MFKQRQVLNKITPWLKRDEILILVGARQVGKTSIMKYLKVGEERNSWFGSLEDFDLLDELNISPKNLIKILQEQAHWQTGEKIVVFLDEIQYLNDPSHFLKYIYDHHAEDIKLIVSGSSAFYINQKFTDSLAGRKKIFNIYPLNFDEYLLFSENSDLLELRKNYASLTTLSQAKLKEVMSQFFRFGGYPKVVLAENTEIKKQLLAELVNSYLKKDILEYNIKYPEKLHRLYKILALQSGNLVNKNELGNTLGLTTTAIENYLFLLQKSFHIYLLKPFSQNIRKELVKTPKVYLSDTGLRNYLENNFNVLDDRPDKGNLLEMIVFHELQKNTDEEIFFWRTQDKKEVDFVLPSLSRAIEVKYTKNNNKIKSLEFLSDTYGFYESVISISEVISKKLI